MTKHRRIIPPPNQIDDHECGSQPDNRPNDKGGPAVCFCFSRFFFRRLRQALFDRNRPWRPLAFTGGGMAQFDQQKPRNDPPSAQKDPQQPHDKTAQRRHRQKQGGAATHQQQTGNRRGNPRPAVLNGECRLALGAPIDMTHTASTPTASQHGALGLHSGISAGRTLPIDLWQFRFFHPAPITTQIM